MNLAKFPRKKYTESYTPIEKLNNFSEALGGPAIYFKRDDLLGLTAGGNKTRKLEFLVADAQEKGCRYVNYSWWYSVKSLPPDTCCCSKRKNEMYSCIRGRA